jgi:hypothetical protein
MIRRVFFAGLAVVLLASLSGSALAAEGGTKQVGLVVTFPDGTEYTEVVTVPASATMIEAIQAAKLELASADTDFGPAVCGINKVGCPSENCFCDKDHFWAYYHLDPAATKWQASAQGVGAFVPANGAVEGMVWSGMDASYQPTDQPKIHTFQQLAGGAPQGLPVTGSGLPPLALAVGMLLAAAGLAGRTTFGRRPI